MVGVTRSGWGVGKFMRIAVGGKVTKHYNYRGSIDNLKEILIVINDVI